MILTQKTAFNNIKDQQKKIKVHINSRFMCTYNSINGNNNNCLSIN